MAELLHFSLRLPLAVVVFQESWLMTLVLVPPHSVTVHTRYSHRRTDRTCEPVAPIPCPTRRAECSTATVKVVHPGAFLPVVLSSDHSTSSRLVDNCVSYSAHSLNQTFRTLKGFAFSSRLHASYAISFRWTSALPAASFRFHLAMDTLAVQLTVPPVGSVGDFHSLVRAPCRAHKIERTAGNNPAALLFFKCVRNANMLAALERIPS